MDYVVGSVAALISGNVTPNRPKLLRRALTPTKQQSSPNVTPKSQLVDDRSIFLSPTQQKKKAIVKKSPKRIFQNSDLDTTAEGQGNSTMPSPKAEKVKKHLKDELDSDDKSCKSKKSPSHHLNKSTEEISPKKKGKILDNSEDVKQTPSKKKKKFNMETVLKNENSLLILNTEDNVSTVITNSPKSPKKPKQKCKSITVTSYMDQDEAEEALIASQSTNKKSKAGNGNKAEAIVELQQIENDRKKNKKQKNKNKKANEKEIKDKGDKENQFDATTASNISSEIKKKKNKKNKSKVAETREEELEEYTKLEKIKKIEEESDQSESDSEEVKAKNIANPNAITDKDSDSEHDSDDEIESENERSNEKVLKNEDAIQQSSDEEEEKEEVKKNEPKSQEMSEEEVKRTLFIGNVKYSSKCKKEIKKIFNQYGQIDTVRIRTIPVKDARVTPKLAVIKNELHPERTTVNMYIKFADEESVTKALKENNTVLNGNHLRVTRSATTGAEHDPRCAVFIGNLPFAIEDDTLRAKFQNCGEIMSVRVIRDKKTNAGKGFGYVNFATKDGVELALAMSEEDLTIKNRILRVNRCTQSGSKGQKKLGTKKFGGPKEGQKFGGQQFGGPKGGHKFGDKKFGSPQRKWGGGQDRNNQVRGVNQYKNQGQWNQGRNQQTNYQGQREDTGATRRIMAKRQHQESTDGPPNKKQNVNKEKKPKKEFVGMTAEKKKKTKFNKDFKKKKALSEILMKK